MIFNSWTFLAFFAVVLSVHHLPINWTARKVNLLLASYLFYAAWNPPFVILLWLATMVDWFVARAMAEAATSRARKALLGVSLVVNLGLLGYFKYGGFLLENFVQLLAAAGIYYRPAPMDIVLPVGISFYTFVTLSYTIDVYRGTIPACRRLLDYSLLVTFFPHLVAGPILRADQFLPQCESPKRANQQQLGWGGFLLLVGLFEKVALADGVFAPVVGQVYDSGVALSARDAWAGTLAFAAQIFFDFNGYSLCAIGAAMCLGFVFPDNFRFPYAAVGFSDFWRRWHISLSSWLRDYLYIALGGNRHGTARTYLNLFMTMLLGGLWHGASWNFVIWGGLHGAYLAIERFARGIVSPIRGAMTPTVQLLGALVTFLCVCLAWVFFRARHFDEARRVLSAMFGGSGGLSRLGQFEVASVFGLTAVLLGVHWLWRDKSLEQVIGNCRPPLVALLVGGMIWGLATAPGDLHAFIYFQF